MPRGEETGEGMLIGALARLVSFSTRFAVAIVVVSLALALLAGIFAAGHLAVDTDSNNLISPDLPWRKQEAAFDNAFPQNVDLLAVVIDAAHDPGQAEDAAARLAQWAESRPDLFKTVRRPDGGEFFTRNGLLFLAVGEVQDVADQLIAAQPLLGALAVDPSLRGLFSSMDLALEGVRHGDIKLAMLDGPFAAFAGVVDDALAGQPHHLSWESVFTGRTPQPLELRRFILVQPVLDYSALEPGARASGAIRQAVADFGFTAEHGLRVRLTGPVALADEEFATVAQGAGGATLASFLLVFLVLFLALRSWRIILAILVTLVVGLTLTAGFAAAAVGALNLISVAFAVLFIGLAVDFSIQFSTRYRDERHRLGRLDAALARTAGSISGPLFLAAATTAVGFFAFVPTDYSGVSELGIISGTSMLIALLLNFTLLPATLSLLHPPGETEPVGFAWAAGIDAFLVDQRRPIIALALILAAGGAVLLPQWRFDFDPLNLKDPHSESVATLFDLMHDPSTTPYTVDILQPSLAAADALAARLEKLPEVVQVVGLSSYMPEEQDQKLAILADAALLLGPTLSPQQIKPPPDDAANLAAIAAFAKNLTAIAGVDAKSPAARLAHSLDQALARGASLLPVLHDSMIAGLGRRLDDLRLSLAPQKVSLDTLPEDMRRSYVTADGRARLEVFPKGNPRDRATLRRFVAAVRAVAPEATGTPVTIQESGDTVVGAFTRAGLIALVAITTLLLVLLRRIWDVLLVLLPLLLAGLLTAATSTLLGLPLNYANIITLPLLLGIGVAFDIYFVMRWRAGEGGPLQSSTARAVLFSALTTTIAFGSLALARHPGTAEMGRLLTIALFYVLLCTFFVLPALQGPPRRKAVSS